MFLLLTVLVYELTRGEAGDCEFLLLPLHTSHPVLGGDFRPSEASLDPIYVLDFNGDVFAARGEASHF